ncbi:MAG: winged helix-turn-helix transcriptional regulator [Anaerolineae bacterium]|nr:winged helix-turn-helix transcriptional regulator [Anaerolineae bacterium]
MTASEPVILEHFEPAARLLKLLAHPARLAILDVLRREEACVCHLEAVLGLRQAYISQQLALLREGGLIEDRREGWNVYYRVSNRRVFDLMDMTASVAAPEGMPEVRYDKRKCPCPKCNGVIYPL